MRGAWGPPLSPPLPPAQTACGRAAGRCRRKGGSGRRVRWCLTRGVHRRALHTCSNSLCWEARDICRGKGGSGRGGGGGGGGTRGGRPVNTADGNTGHSLFRKVQLRPRLLCPQARFDRVHAAAQGGGHAQVLRTTHHTGRGRGRELGLRGVAWWKDGRGRGTAFAFSQQAAPPASPAASPPSSAAAWCMLGGPARCAPSGAAQSHSSRAAGGRAGGRHAGGRVSRQACGQARLQGCCEGGQRHGCTHGKQLLLACRQSTHPTAASHPPAAAQHPPDSGTHTWASWRQLGGRRWQPGFPSAQASHPPTPSPPICDHRPGCSTCGSKPSCGMTSIIRSDMCRGWHLVAASAAK